MAIDLKKLEEKLDRVLETETEESFKQWLENKRNMELTPKEKAIELIDQYRLILIHSETDAGEEILCTTIAKQCALVSVDEIIKANPKVKHLKSSISYWQEVLREIKEY